MIVTWQNGNWLPNEGYTTRILIKLLDSTTISDLVSQRDLAPVVQTMDSAVHRINYYPADKH